MSIRPVEDPEDFHEIVRVQLDAWDMQDPTEATPFHVLTAMARNGGIVLGAYLEPEGRMVGAVFGFLGREGGRRGRIYHYSHQAGVIREFQGMGIGLALKLAQREVALSQGLDLMRWTFDPIQGVNARFNLSKLGVVVRVYKRNYYGIMRDRLNQGLRTDRFVAEWYLESPRVRRRIEGRHVTPPPRALLEAGAGLALETEGEGPLRRPVSVNPDLDSEVVLVEIPWDHRATREAGGPGLLAAWRDATAEAFESYFSRGYVDVDHCLDGGERRSFHVLWRRPLEEILSGEEVPR